MENVLSILQPVLIILVVVGIFVIRYNLGYPIYFNMSYMIVFKYSLFYKEGMGFKAKKATGYIMQKIKTKDFNNIKFILNNNIEKGEIYIYLLDRNKNAITSFDREDNEKFLKVNSNEVYYLRVIYEKAKGKFDLSYELL
ncbi:hypothetical protein [[Clostridium] colinum]|uniref:hypothetical protein n=1 Tax=[Clostridium] colinum TaxID=36835 RepID=UPI0020252710|nr:hypothetical protein [[Clostridium] colinum]